ncbi:MAG: hypothetical protein A2Y28_02755 [Chlamydiae bacterium GWC2_50_10]|nr:MAG: hypothetical protein A2Z85_04555 [Chlamydiae bacterium GWA2_50_15]OGN54770.1 MAG: hypothetical protein A2Y28_02755 [Chlamydiae bacterium GWC2_50_10]OGN58740.1 MAG: hypothetical protein A3D18_03875 [Chlamydiae bacterium RIFCSPHIGHO2_02_FULL_49_29]OGN64362.1 MAG: hypothetical protein A3E26_03160 [Chlamydiae bacterium RIFCSPHIGHO2_12_FULL_49_32]OGN70483.1 MAG: hypothetical protein A3I15_02990 [Chlamydiae bacterium RIFCSPLOWO2_02_FULL_49_12]OGN71530.1 MAG: hypothetical protein A3G30_03835 
MRCTSYSTAARYNISRLLQSLKTSVKAQSFRDTVYAQYKEEKQAPKEAFYFPYGAAVFWGFSEEEEKNLVASLKEYEVESLPKLEFDEFTFTYGRNMAIAEDEIILQNKNPLTKLAVSHGLAQSVKLSIFEETVQKTIDHTQILPQNLARRGKIFLSRKEISQKMGELFMERNFINLHADILDIPEFFWDHPDLEPFYRRTAHYLDVSKRADLLNKRLTVIHELFEILSSELNHQHSSRLEWTIIVLIVIEVFIALLRDLFHVI